MLPVSFVALGAFVGLVLTVTPLFLDSVFALTVSQRGLVQAIGSAASSTASILSARIGARYPTPTVLTAALALFVIGLVVLGAAPNLWFVGLGLALAGGGSGSIFPVFQDFSASVGPQEYRGSLVGSWVSANRLGQTLGPVAGTGIADAFGERSSFLFGAGLIGTVMVVWMPVRRKARDFVGRRT
jgi:MFS family permease